MPLKMGLGWGNLWKNARTNNIKKWLASLTCDAHVVCG